MNHNARQIVYSSQSSIASPNNATPKNNRSLQGTIYIQVTALLLVNSYVIFPFVVLYLCKNLMKPMNSSFRTMHLGK